MLCERWFSRTSAVFVRPAASNAQGLSVCRVNVQFVFISNKKKKKTFSQKSRATGFRVPTRVVFNDDANPSFSIAVILRVPLMCVWSVNVVRIRNIWASATFLPTPCSYYRSVSYTFIRLSRSNIACSFYIPITHIFPRLNYAQDYVLKRTKSNCILKYFFPSHRRFP